MAKIPRSPHLFLIQPLCPTTSGVLASPQWTLREEMPRFPSIGSSMTRQHRRSQLEIQQTATSKETSRFIATPCRLFYRFDDLSGVDFTSNVQDDFVNQEGIYNIIELRGFFQTSINLSATDAFQRQTWLNLSVLPLETTNINPNQFFSDEKINMFCREDAPTATHREIVCLWRRTTLGAVRVPLAFDVILDTNHSRTFPTRPDVGRH